MFPKSLETEYEEVIATSSPSDSCVKASRSALRAWAPLSAEGLDFRCGSEDGGGRDLPDPGTQWGSPGVARWLLPP